MFTIFSYGQPPNPHSRPLPIVGQKHVQAFWYGLVVGLLGGNDSTVFNTKFFWRPPGVTIKAGQVPTTIDSTGEWIYTTLPSLSAQSTTVSQFQDRITGDSLDYPATYLLTDVEAGLYLQTTSSNSFNPLGTLLMYTPDYTITGAYTGQLLPADAVTIGDKCIWGNKIWESTTGVNASVDDWELSPTDFNLLTPSLANHYLLSTFIAEFDAVSGTLVSIKQPTEQNTAALPPTLTGFLSVDAVKGNQWANSTLPYFSNTGLFSANNRLDNGFIFNNSGIASAYNNLSAGGVIANNTGYAGTGRFTGNDISNGSQLVECNLSSNSEYSNNTLTDGGKLVSIASHNSEIKNCTISGDGDNDIGYGRQQDACVIYDCQLTGIGCKIEAFQQNNNSAIGGISFSGTDNTMSATYQQIMDTVKNINVTGDGFFMGAITQNGYSKLSNFDISANNSAVTNITMSNSTIDSVSHIVSARVMKNVSVSNTYISKISEISVTDCSFENCSLRLAGFSSDISNVTINGKSGTFSYNVDFSTAPITAGNFIQFGLIPKNAVISKVTFVTNALSGTGSAALSLGIPVNDTSYVFPTTLLGSIGSITIASLSNVTTDNRPLKLTATGGNTTGGKISVVVEFIILDGATSTIGSGDVCNTGWGSYASSTADSMVLTSATYVTLKNNATTRIETQLPCDIDSFYSRTDTAILAKDGDDIIVQLDFKARPTTNISTQLDIRFFIGGAIGGFYEKTINLAKGQNITQGVAECFSLYAGSTWAANGAKIQVKTDHAVNLMDMRLVIKRTHKAQ